MRTETSRPPSRQGTVRHWALGLLAAALLLAGCEGHTDRDQKAADAAYREKLAKAKAIFAERCKTAGVVIHRTVRDVEGIELTKIRPKLEFADKRYFDPMFEGAAMAGEVSGPHYIRQFLMGEFRYTHSPNQRGTLAPMNTEIGHQQLAPTHGYRFVEVRDEVDNKRYRYRLASDEERKQDDTMLRRQAIERSQVRYALDYEDLVNPADRAYWVAGTRLRVIDKQNGEVIADLTRFVFDPGFGGSSTGRWPWSHAAAAASTVCPGNSSQPNHHDSRYFVDTVLIPKQGD